MNGKQMAEAVLAAYQMGKSDGYEEGYTSGHEDGTTEAEDNMESDLNLSYDEGYDDGCNGFPHRDAKEEPEHCDHHPV